MQLFPKPDRQLIRPVIFIERDGLADVVHDDLARVAACHVLLEFLANGRVNRAVYVVIEHCQHFFALHIAWVVGLSRERQKSYRENGGIFKSVSADL